MPPTCGKQNMFGDQECVREPGHLGLHRDARTVRKCSAQWGDNETKQGD